MAKKKPPLKLLVVARSQDGNMLVLVNGKPYRYVVDAMYHNEIEHRIKKKNHRGALDLIQLHDKSKGDTVETLADKVIGMSEKWAKGHKELVDRLSDDQVFASKPRSWKAVPKISQEQVDKTAGYLDGIATIPTLTDVDIFGEKVDPKGSPNDLDFVKEVPMLFFMETALGTFLVNTEGSSYPKYIVKMMGV